MAELTLKKKYSKREFQARADEILGRLFREARGFEDDSELAKKERRDRGRSDHLEFFRTYLPHYFSQEFAPFHRELIELLDRRPGKNVGAGSTRPGRLEAAPTAAPTAPPEVVIPVAVAAPREFAKTTITSFGYVLHQLCYGLLRFIIIGSDTEDLASDLTGYIYLELLYNDRIKCDFGELVRPDWAVNDFVTLTDIRVKARGRGQRLRGLKHKQWRPDLIVLDDLENDLNVQNPEQVRKVLRWVLRTVYPSIEADGSLLWIGTILANRSALHTAIHSDEEPWPEWTRRLYRAITAEGESLWPARHPLSKLHQQKRLMGTLAFNAEKMNDPINEEGVFREAWLRFYEAADLAGKEMVVAGFFDPSIETGASADYKAIIIVGYERKEAIFYVLDAYIRKSSLEAAIAAAYERHQRWGFWRFGVEDNAFQRLVLKDFDRAAKARGYYLPVRGITHKTAKETRISRLSPLVERGKIRFCRGQGNQDLLIEQMLYFPSKTVHDDGPDALEGAIEQLEGGASMGLFEFLREEAESLDAPPERQALPAPAEEVIEKAAALLKKTQPDTYKSLMDPWH